MPFDPAAMQFEKSPDAKSAHSLRVDPFGQGAKVAFHMALAQEAFPQTWYLGT